MKYSDKQLILSTYILVKTKSLQWTPTVKPFEVKVAMEPVVFVDPFMRAGRAHRTFATWPI